MSRAKLLAGKGYSITTRLAVLGPHDSLTHASERPPVHLTSPGTPWDLTRLQEPAPLTSRQTPDPGPP